MKYFIKESIHYKYLMQMGTTLFKADEKHIKIISPLIQLLGPITLVILIALIWEWTYPSPGGAGNHSTKAPKSIAVVVASAHTEDVPLSLTALGSVTPLSGVTIKTQVSGRLVDVLFKEGQTVKKGDLLIKIDSRFYEAQLLQNEGQLARDMALLANAKLDLKRYKELYQQNSVSQQILDTQVHLVKQYEGTVKSDQGLVDTARVNVSYCRLVSPIDGRIGLRLVDPGNFVQASDPNGMAIVNTIHPITVVFTLPEDNIPQVLKQMKAAKPLSVEAFDRGQKKLLSTGKLLTIDNQIDPTTGTVKLKAEFQNEDDNLFPNQFVNVKLLVDTLLKAIVVPTAAIQHGVNGTYVYLLMNNDTVKITPVITGVTTGNNTVITTGVEVDQIIVTEGADKLTDGAKVTIPPEKKSEKVLQKALAKSSP